MTVFVSSSGQGLTLAEPTALDLRCALERREFILDYQPLVEVRTGKVAGFEALVRWRHPVAGVVGPGRFIQRCEDSGVILELGQWILAEACRQRARWRDAGLVDGSIAVNVSPIELADPRYLTWVLDTLENTGLRPQHLEIEITESALVASFDRVRDTIVALRRHRIGVALDDFGTGYSFLRSLRSFGVDKLKIPIDFICGLGEDPDCDAILDAILALGHRLGHTIVAEGVETPEQLTLLRDRGCDLAQGNFLCPASAPEAVLAWLDRGGLAASLRAAPERRGGSATPARATAVSVGHRADRIRVVIVDDQDIARRTIARVLSQAGDVELVGEAVDGHGAIDVVRGAEVDIVLLDVSMPGKGGLETLRELKAMRSDLAVIVLSMHPEDPYAVRFLREGAHGYMLKERAGEELVGALRTVRTGRRYVSQSLLDQLVRFAARRR